MNTDKELMQQALEALKFGLHVGFDESSESQIKKGGKAFDQHSKAIAALRERLAQPEMQPCAGRNCGSTNPNLHSAECFEDYEKATGMNQWHGLTDEEIAEGQRQSWVDKQAFESAAWWAEAKLREKNA